MKSCLRVLGLMAALNAPAGVAEAGQADAPAPGVEQGRRIYATCLACHAADATGPAGPDLRGVFGRKAGTLPGYRFSRALRNSRIVWDTDTLDAFLSDPQAAVPGNLMPFPGLPDEEARRGLIAFLRTLK